ncbi:hypothetical protein EI983_11145 [Roseovarius faecimaris]|uniref:Phytanoyl-CoA dioxygenase n=1 Tax=Roseovarius faecimaris TaxID=2494550 RepID=A0A6I6IPZ7_9RHOB|nr:hypothetical protein [Roseovarius faecimaris]QGX98795.1 hypothetical protein EI983_11145 [Roseovarius faecimaris]
MVAALLERGWAHWPVEPAVTEWVRAARPVAEAAARDPAQRAEWLQCEGTWFVGVDALENDAAGAVAGSGPLTGSAYAAATALYGALALHRAQVSIIYPGYPKPRTGEGEAAFGYRLKRDAAHVDGLLPAGPNRERMLKERHAYILGLPLTEASADASPLVVWDGSHHIMRALFHEVLADLPESAWADTDLTARYQEARREVFDTCARIELPARPGEATLIHRHTLHGVAPWGQGAEAEPAGRMIAYFRPECAPGTRDWLEAP